MVRFQPFPVLFPSGRAMDKMKKPATAVSPVIVSGCRRKLRGNRLSMQNGRFGFTMFLDRFR